MAAVLLVLAGAGCAGGQAARQEFRRSFQRVFRSYQRFEPDKSLALARDEDGGWAYGYAKEQESDLQAVNAAKAQCQDQRARYGVAAPCRTYAVGDEITGDPALVEGSSPE